VVRFFPQRRESVRGVETLEAEQGDRARKKGIVQPRANRRRDRYPPVACRLGKQLRVPGQIGLWGFSLHHLSPGPALDNNAMGSKPTMLLVAKGCWKPTSLVSKNEQFSGRAAPSSNRRRVGSRIVIQQVGGPQKPIWEITLLTPSASGASRWRQSSPPPPLSTS
jgi:hypothetical protein